ncbi:MAG: SDR family oxidoreductase [Planctomycetes bacterium]|nr:SDR family oxidoreductase [Planctomycetota bacterium]
MNKIDSRVKTALVTGSARRNGRALALWLAGRGVKVAIHYNSSRDEAESALAEAGDGVIVQGDLTDADQAAKVVNDARAGLGGLDLLVNNVGNYLRKDLFELTPREWRDQLESNLYSAYFCMREVMKHMREAGFGRVVNIGYAGGERPTYNRLTVPYHIAKTGVATLTRSAASAVAKQGITINSIGIGIMENSIVKPVSPPAGRFANYDDLCNALAFLISPDSDHINGSQIDVNGGWIPEQIL